MALKTSIQQEKIIFAYMLKKPKYLMQLGSGFFLNDDVQYIANCAKQFYIEYKEVPSCVQMKALLKDDKKEISNEIIESIYDCDITGADMDWLRDTTEGWIRWRAVNTNIFNAATYLKTTDVSLSNVNHIVDKCVEMVSDTNMITFDDNLGMDFFNPDCHVSVKENKIPFTWDYWNKVSKGGLDRKTLHAYIGGTNVGKCCQYDTKIRVRNKKTGEIKEIKIGDFFQMCN